MNWNKIIKLLLRYVGVGLCFLIAVVSMAFAQYYCNPLYLIGCVTYNIVAVLLLEDARKIRKSKP